MNPRLCPNACRHIVAAVTLALLLAPTALASHSFPADVPDDHPFHNEIGVFKDTNITTGCSATAFCPADYVRRQTMAVFIDRALGLVVRPGESTQTGVPGSRVAMLDDGVSLVGTGNEALELLHNGARVLRLEGSSSPNVIAGSSGNVAIEAVAGAAIGGGGTPSGQGNRVTDNYGTIAGGAGNRAGDEAGTTVDRPYATVGGGQSNHSDGNYATVGGGYANTAGGFGATVAGGHSNAALGTYSFAAGRRAKANDNGSFVWGDSVPVDLVSNGVNSFRARAIGGFQLYTNTAHTTGCSIAAGGGSWSCSSDRALKRHFAPVDGRALLGRLATVPITTWSYTSQSPSIRHIGPVAQDFARAFRVGENDNQISMVDADGVALAAIQALHRENEALERRLIAVERALREKGRTR